MCGPQSFVYDVRNAVAQCELDIVDGYSRCQEIYLHAEAYECVFTLVAFYVPLADLVYSQLVKRQQ